MKERQVGGKELIHEEVDEKKPDRGGWARKRHKGWVRKKRNSQIRDVKGQESTFRSGMGPGVAYKGPESFLNLPLQQGEILKSSVKPRYCFCFLPVHTGQVHPLSHRLRNKKVTQMQENASAFGSA